MENYHLTSMELQFGKTKNVLDMDGGSDSGTTMYEHTLNVFEHTMNVLHDPNCTTLTCGKRVNFI